MFDFLKQVGKAVADGMGLINTLDAAVNGGTPASAQNPQDSANNAPPQANEPTRVVPDKPVPFGYKNSWLCVKADSPEEVIEKVGLKNPRVSNWNDGVYGKHNGVFVSPVLDGHVLVVGWEGDILDTNPARLDELAKKFTELQFFSTHRVAEYHVWAKFVDGKPLRVYGYCAGDIRLVENKGVPTPEEIELHCDDFPVDNDVDPDVAIFPDEECVLNVAAAWGIDTLFHKKTYPESTGFICDV